MNIGRIIKNIIWGILLSGLMYALLRAFNYDPFAIVEWAWNGIFSIVTRIADFLTGNAAFQEVTKAP